MGNKLRLLIGALTGLMLVISMAVLSGAEPRGPRISTHHEIFDFGIVPEYAEVSHVFWLRNSGDEPVTIDKLIPNCGCTQASIGKHSLEPGDSSRVELIFGSHNYHHQVEKFAQVVSNARGRVPALTFEAYVVADSETVGPLEAIPRALDFGKLPPEKDGSSWVSRFTLVNHGKAPVTVTTIDKPDQVIATDGFNGTLQPGEKTEVTVRFNVDVQAEPFSKSLTFKVSGDTEERLTVPIFKYKDTSTSQVEENAQAGTDS